MIGWVFVGFGGFFAFVLLWGIVKELRDRKSSTFLEDFNKRFPERRLRQLENEMISYRPNRRDEDYASSCSAVYHCSAFALDMIIGGDGLYHSIGDPDRPIDLSGLEVRE